MTLAQLRSRYDMGLAVMENALVPPTSDTIRKVKSFVGDYGPAEVRPLLNLAADAAADIDRVYSAPTRRMTESDIYLQSLDSRSTFAQAYRLSLKYPATFGQIVN